MLKDVLNGLTAGHIRRGHFSLKPKNAISFEFVNLTMSVQQQKSILYHWLLQHTLITFPRLNCYHKCMLTGASVSPTWTAARLLIIITKAIHQYLKYPLLILGQPLGPFEINTHPHTYTYTDTRLSHGMTSPTNVLLIERFP